MDLKKATDAEVADVALIYEAVKGVGYCVWNEDYPTAEIAADDQSAGCLYVLKDGNEIIGCASVEPVPEEDDLPFWRINDGPHRERSRIAVLPSHQGKGLAKTMVSLLTDALKREGVRSIHLLAAKENPPAYRTYDALGFDLIGECFRYGHDYYVFEKLL